MAVKETTIDLRHTVGGVELYAKAAEYDSEGNKITTTYSTVDATETALATKQDKPSSSTAGDIATFDSGSSTVDSGKSFLNSTGTWDGTSDSLVPTAKSIQSKLDEKYTRPVSGIPTTDLDSTVNASLGKADSAIQHVYAGPDELVPDNTKTVTIPYAEVIPAHVVTIGGRAYKAVVIGGKEWLAENLDFKFDGLTIGQGASEYEPRANYYNKDETTYGVNGNKYGLLYNWLAVKYLTDNKSELIPGWHVPTKAEWDALATAVGGASVAGTKLKSTTGWSSGNGDGTYGFDAVPAGEQYKDQFSNLSNYANFWTADDDSTANRYYRSFNTGTSMTSSYSRKDWGISVRLVRDTTSTDDPTFKGGLLTTSMVEKLDGIEAHAEVNVQADWNVSDNTSDAFIKNKPSLATVATSGSYADLSNTPTIPVVPESTTTTIDSTAYLRTYDGHSVYAARTDCDKDGNDLTLGIDGTTNTVTDNSGEPVHDSSGNPLADAESDARVVSIGELPIWADRAEKDTSGNDIEATYATKQELEDALGDLETILASI